MLIRALGEPEVAFRLRVRQSEDNAIVRVAGNYLRSGNSIAAVSYIADKTLGYSPEVKG